MSIEHRLFDFRAGPAPFLVVGAFVDLAVKTSPFVPGTVVAWTRDAWDLIDAIDIALAEARAGRARSWSVLEAHTSMRERRVVARAILR